MEFETIKYIKDTLELDILASPSEQTAWLSKEQIGTLFNRDRSAITKQINKIYKEGELDKDSTCAKIAQVQKEGTRYVKRVINFYNLDVVISIGYQIKSQNGLLLKEWVRDNFLKKAANIVVFNDDGIRLDVTIEPSRETVWLSATQMASLFDTSTDNVYLHIKNLCDEGEINLSVTEESSATQKNNSNCIRWKIIYDTSI